MNASRTDVINRVFVLLSTFVVSPGISCKILRTLLYISTLIILILSCSTQDKEKIQEKRTFFHTLAPPNDSTTFYFKTKHEWKGTNDNALDTFVNTWYSKMLFALKEPVLKEFNGDKEIYRFTWLRTFHHPVSVRLEKQGGVVKLFSKVCNGAGGYEPGQIIFDTIFSLTQKQVDTTNIKLDLAKFWTLQTESRENVGLDGSEWIIEVYKRNKYHMVVRWTPDNGTAFRNIGDYLFSISQIKNEKGEHSDY